jgi:hypothetical protein
MKLRFANPESPPEMAMPQILAPLPKEAILETGKELEPLVFNEDVLDLINDKVELITLPNALVKERAGPRQIARVVSEILHNGRSDSVRLRAAEIAAGMGGLDKGKEASNISIIIQDSNVNLNNLFCPTR